MTGTVLVTGGFGLVGSETVKQLVEKLSAQFDYVLVDLSPLAPVIDVRSTGQFIQLCPLQAQELPARLHRDLAERVLGGAGAEGDAVDFRLVAAADLEDLAGEGGVKLVGLAGDQHDVAR